MLARSSLTKAVRTATALRTVSPAQAPLLSAIRHYADDHGHGSKRPPMHKEEWLEIARNWPHEYHYPGNYRADSPDEIFPPSDNLGHKSDAPSGAETLQQTETYANAFWMKVFLGIAATATLYNINERYSAGKEVHPFTEWLGQREKLFTAEKAHADHAKWIAIKQREADDRLVVTDAWEPRPHRISFPGAFQRASDHLIDVGSQVDVSDVKIRHTWQLDDDVAGPPYPKKG
ncbi:hypothetical protein PhCBS80983_g00326 [Powellomyces hirtus]|uniref:Uncharacterized protein n=1 Tax=Powellomyces hirtus TaxID=109895 RepID=A0A507EEM3_9FUNG|nr:hypothetical protein PhCBS80983_g00326 [Powellomyces hirtus]